MPDLLYYLRRMRELGLGESLRQAHTLALDQMARRFNGIYDRHFGPRHDEVGEKLVEELHRSGIFDQIRTRTDPRFFLDRDPSFYRDVIQEHFPAEKGRLVFAAQRILDHEFDLLGSGPCRLDALRWNEDFKTGYQWAPETYYRDVQYGNVPGVDVKVPWELSRFQHLIVLGQAYWLTGDEKYVREFRTQILDWIEKNPWKYGVNWACTMDVGIRAVNWVWGFYFFRRSPLIDDAFLKAFLKSLYVHARFIRFNLEYRVATVQGKARRLNSNHYLSNLIGLLYIAMLFPELKLEDDAKFAESEFCIEILEQTYADGVDYEHSTFYHRLVTEIFLSAFLLLKRNGRALPQDAEERLQAMGAYVADYLRPDGTAPQIGDADNGRLHPLSLRDMSDHQYIPLILAEIYGRDDLRVADGDIEALWWIAATPSQVTHLPRQSVRYSNAGFSILRSSETHVFVCGASVGMHGLGSHSHNDILSFEYWTYGRAWIVDPGTYLYTSDAEARNYFRSTEAHNVVRIDGLEINPIPPNRLFQMTDRSRVVVHTWQDTAHSTELDLERTGSEVVHRRRFRLLKDTGVLEIEDSFSGQGSHEFEWFFHLSPGTACKASENLVTLRHHVAALRLGFEDAAVQCTIKDGWFSASYGLRESASIIVARMARSVPFTVTIVVGPATRI